MAVTGSSTQSILSWRAGRYTRRDDLLVEEEPLEILVGYGAPRQRQSLSVTMRTPGQDVDLALGFLFTEGIIARPEQVVAEQQLDTNRLLLNLAADLPYDPSLRQRNFFASSSCGICGKASLEAVETLSCYYPRPGWPRLEAAMLTQLPRKLGAAQSLFQATGGIHAAALFDVQGGLRYVREDVGRHNAVDKVIGAALRAGDLPLSNQLLLVSGRAGFELAQKAAMAGLPLLAAIGAPSAAAIAMAEQAGMTLVGFLRPDRFNIYCGVERLQTTNEIIASPGSDG